MTSPFSNLRATDGGKSFYYLMVVRLRIILGLIRSGNFEIAYLLIKGFLRKRIHEFITYLRKLRFNKKQEYKRVACNLDAVYRHKLASDLPLVSVIVPHVNYSDYLEPCLQSISNSTLNSIEILVIDSKSDTNHLNKFVNISGKIEDERVRFFFRGRHKLGNNRNFGIKKSNGLYMVSFDPDDSMHPNYLEITLFLAIERNLQIVGTKIDLVGLENGSWGGSGPIFLKDLILENKIPSHALFDKEIWIRSGGFVDAAPGEKHVHEDWRFWQRCLAQGSRAFMLDKPRNKVLIHGKNMSRGSELLPEHTQAKLIRESNADVIYQSRSIREKSNWLADSDSISRFGEIVGSRMATKQGSVLVLIPFVDESGVGKILGQAVKLFNQVNIDFVVVETLNAVRDFKSELVNGADLFNLIEEIPIESRTNFITYLISSRRVNTIWLLGSKWAYDNLEFLSQFNIKIVDSLFNFQSDHFKSSIRRSDFIDFVTFESMKLRDMYLEFGGTSETVITPNGIQPFVYQKQNFPKDKFKIAFVGRLSPEKDPLAFVEIARKYNQKWPDSVDFQIFGDGPLRSKIEEASSEISNLHIFGHVRDENEIWSDLSLLLITSTEVEGRPNVLLEALSRGIPVLSFDVGFINELLSEVSSELLVPNRDIKKMVELVNKFKDVNHWEKISREAYEITNNKCTWEKFFYEYSKLFEIFNNNQF